MPDSSVFDLRVILARRENTVRNLLLGLLAAAGLTYGYYALFGALHALGPSALSAQTMSTPFDPPATAPIARRGDLEQNPNVSYEVLSDLVAYVDQDWYVIGKVRKTSTGDLNQASVQYLFFDEAGTIMASPTAPIFVNPSNDAEGFYYVSIPDRASEYRLNTKFTGN